MNETQEFPEHGYDDAEGSEATLNLKLLDVDCTRLTSQWRYQLCSFLAVILSRWFGGRCSVPRKKEWRMGPGEWWCIPAWTHFETRFEAGALPLHGPTVERSVHQYHVHFHVPALGPNWCRQHVGHPFQLIPVACARAGSEMDERTFFQELSSPSFCPLSALLNLWLDADSGLERDHLTQAMLQAAWAGILATMSEQVQEHLTNRQRNRHPLRRAEVELGNSLRDPPSVAELARCCGYSSDHFARLVKQYEAVRRGSGLSSGEFRWLLNNWRTQNKVLRRLHLH